MGETRPTPTPLRRDSNSTTYSVRVLLLFQVQGRGSSVNRRDSESKEETECTPITIEIPREYPQRPLLRSIPDSPSTTVSDPGSHGLPAPEETHDDTPNPSLVHTAPGESSDDRKKSRRDPGPVSSVSLL